MSAKEKERRRYSVNMLTLSLGPVVVVPLICTVVKVSLFLAAKAQISCTCISDLRDTLLDFLSLSTPFCWSYAGQQADCVAMHVVVPGAQAIEIRCTGSGSGMCSSSAGGSAIISANSSVRFRSGRCPNRKVVGHERVNFTPRAVMRPLAETPHGD